VDRRAFIGTIAGGLLAAPLAAEAQPTGKVPRIALVFANAPLADITGPRPAQPYSSSRRSCVTINAAVVLDIRARTSWMTARARAPSSDAVGSSPMSNAGSPERARAIATRCCSPVDSSRGR
jgi:hypothetical protein